MTKNKLRQITHLEIAEPPVVRLSYNDGTVVAVDFSPVVSRGGAWQSLSESEFFRQVRIGEGGRFIEWPVGLDFCADALWLVGQGEQRLAG